MMPSYYLIKASDISTAAQYAPAAGLPNQLFHYVIAPNGPDAIVCAEWVNKSAMDALGTYLGELNSDGSAPQAVYDELNKPEWQVPME